MVRKETLHCGGDVVARRWPQMLAGFHHPLQDFSFSHCGAAVTHCDRVGQHALNSAEIVKI